MSDKKIINGVHDYTEEEEYVIPKSPAVQEHLKWFMGLKLGLMMHWDPGCQLGCIESWPLSDGDASWSRKDVDWTDDIEEFKSQYINANKTFNPVKFRPDKWAALAKECGFKYLLFTTKHHDGFCMFDTKNTDYKITAPDCPFHQNKYADVVGSLFDAFRKEGLAISAYFSKPDWHSDSYWHKDFGVAPTRNVNYDISEHPELWEDFVQFTHKQLIEITSNYGKIDTLWLDGGWVCPNNLNQDIRLTEIVEKIRATTQPHLIVCDRTVGGVNENIITPEQKIPSNPINVPWESNLTLGNNFAFHYFDEYKSALTIVQTLIDVVSKGGNLALNLTPQPDGNLPVPAIHILRQLGNWLKINGKGIYNTHICEIECNRNIKYTQNLNTIYAFYIYDNHPFMPSKVNISINRDVLDVKLLRTGESIPFAKCKDSIVLNTSNINLMNAEYADCFEIICS